MNEKGFANCCARELQFVIAGTATVCEFNLLGFFKKVFDFIKEYHQEIIRGLQNGWYNF